MYTCFYGNETKEQQYVHIYTKNIVNIRDPVI